MTIRTFKQTGKAYGPNPVFIVAKIDGVEVFNGTVSSVNEPADLGGSGTVIEGDDLFTWTNDVEFAGTFQLEIAVSGGDVLLTATKADNTLTADPSDPNKAISSGNVFKHFNYDKSTGLADPFSDVKLDGVLQSDADPSQYPGQWYRLIPPGSIFSATVTTKAGLAPV